MNQISRDWYECFKVLLALAALDQKIDIKERDWLTQNIKKSTHLSEAQKSELIDQIGTFFDYERSFSRINNYFIKNKLIDQIRTLMNIDGILNPKELKAYKKLKEIHELQYQDVRDLERKIAKELSLSESEINFFRELKDFNNERAKFFRNKKFLKKPLSLNNKFPKVPAHKKEYRYLLILCTAGFIVLLLGYYLTYARTRW